MNKKEVMQLIDEVVDSKLAKIARDLHSEDSAGENKLELSKNNSGLDQKEEFDNEDLEKDNFFLSGP